MKIVNPPGWPQPRGYSNGIAASGRFVFVAGQVGWKPDGTWEAGDFLGQFRQTLKNTVEVLAAAGAKPEQIARMTIYVTDMKEYLGALEALGPVWMETIGPHFPVAALIEVKGLVDPRAKVEIETTAVLPE
jgi:enamine deaminase RidA (YjgF/YER057c/UK114 family)